MIYRYVYYPVAGRSGYDVSTSTRAHGDSTDERIERGTTTTTTHTTG